MSYKSIDEQFWTDPFIYQLSIKERYLYFYLITNPHTHYTGIYYLPMSVIAEETNLTLKEIKRYLNNFDLTKKVKYDKPYRVVWVVNMAKYQLNNMKEGDNRIKGISNYFKTLHNCKLILEFLGYYKGLNIQFEMPCKPLASPLQAPPISETGTGTGTETETGTGTGDRQTVEAIVSHLNLILGTKYKSNAKETITLIQARLKKGFTIEDFKTVIEKKFIEWGSDSKMATFLRPETLFGTKFEAYLNQVMVKQPEVSKNVQRINEVLTEMEEMDAERRSGQDCIEISSTVS